MIKTNKIRKKSREKKCIFGEFDDEGAFNVLKFIFSERV